MAASKEAHEDVDKLLLHLQQVEAGLIPEDSPPTFTLPQAQDERGLPWFFGPDYNPSVESMMEFEKGPDDESKPEEPSEV